MTKYTNARGVRSTTTVDSTGRVVRSATIEPQTGHEVVNRLEYGPFDVLDAVTDSAGNRTVNGYDILGRRISMSDPSLGKSTTAYNGYGEVVSVRDGTGSTRIERDLLGRPTRELHTAQGTTRTTSYVWDTAANGRGQLAETTSSDDVKTVFTYDAKSRLAKQEWQVPGPNQTRTSYAIETVWDAFGRPEVLKYPQVGNRQFALRFLYEPGGTFDKVVDDATGRALWTLREQDASGLALSEQFGDATTTDRTLDTRDRLKTIETKRTVPGVGGAPDTEVVLERLTYDYGQGELVKSRHYAAPGNPLLQTSEDFTYDFLGRLARWTTDQNSRHSVQDYHYDDLGNLTGLSVPRARPPTRPCCGPGRTATLRYGPSVTSPNAGPTAVRELTEDGTTTEFQYDSAGRQVSGGGRTITWNEFDLPRRIQSGTTDLTFLYDAAGNRTVKQSGPANSTVYVGGAYELAQDCKRAPPTSSTSSDRQGCSDRCSGRPQARAPPPNRPGTSTRTCSAPPTSPRATLEPARRFGEASTNPSANAATNRPSHRPLRYPARAASASPATKPTTKSASSTCADASTTRKRCASSLQTRSCSRRCPPNHSIATRTSTTIRSTSLIRPASSAQATPKAASTNHRQR